MEEATNLSDLADAIFDLLTKSFDYLFRQLHSNRLCCYSNVLFRDERRGRGSRSCHDATSTGY